MRSKATLTVLTLCSLCSLSPTASVDSAAISPSRLTSRYVLGVGDAYVVDGPGGINSFDVIEAYQAGGDASPSFAKSTPANGTVGQGVTPTLRWTATSGAISYELCVAPMTESCSGWNNIGNVSSFQLAPLLPRTAYHWQIRARTGNGPLEANGGIWWNFTTGGNSLGTFAKSTPGHGAVRQGVTPTLTWTPTSGAISYELCIAPVTESCSGWNNIGNVSSFQLAPLLPRTAYHWQIRARTGNGAPEANNGSWWTFTTGGQPSAAFVNNEVIVKLRPTSAATLDLLSAAAIVEVRPLADGSILLMRSQAHGVDELIRILSARSEVEYVEPNYLVEAVILPDDPQFGNLWNLFNTGQSVGGRVGTPGADIGAIDAWSLSTGSRDHVVAVVDTGIDYMHPDLAANIWSAPTAFSVTIGGRSITCAAGTHGFNAITMSCDPMDDHGHGTHVAGTIGATGNNGLGVVGVSWTASIMALKFIHAGGFGTTANAINAIEFALQAKAAFAPTGGATVRVLSNSWGGGGFSQALLDEINKANQDGALFVAAAGNYALNNDATPFYPASYSAPNVIAVAATDNSDGLAWFSNYGRNTVHLGAPGLNILSTVPGSGYRYSSGTSMAAPHVAGAALLVLSHCPQLTTEQVKMALSAGVEVIPSLATTTITGGRLNVARAMNQCQPSPSPPPTTYRVSYYRNGSGCSSTEPNPFRCSYLDGPILVDPKSTPPGDYRVDMVRQLDPNNLVGGLRVWDGTATEGTQYMPGDIIHHTSGQLYVYAHDWYVWDNPKESGWIVSVTKVPPSPPTTYRVSYYRNGSGCSSTEPNPFRCSYLDGPILVDPKSTPPGDYRVDMVRQLDPNNLVGGLRVWDGTATEGTQYMPGDIIHHTSGQLYVYAHDWYVWDNPKESGWIVSVTKVR